MLKQCSSRHQNIAIRGLHYVLEDQTGEQTTMRVNAEAIAICYQRYPYHDNFVSTHPTNRL